VARFLLGMALGCALLVGAGVAWRLRTDGCLGRCGDGTRCEHHRCLPFVGAAPAPSPLPKERRHRSRRPGDAPAAAEVQLHPGDEKMVAQGDALGRAEHIDLTQAGDDGHELSQEDLDRVMRGAEPAITRCITDAVGDAPLERARVEVGLRVEKQGQVSRVRVEAPALLQRQGVTRCIRGVVTALRFLPSGGASVVTYPYELK
jgi:hypothetical protein